MPDHGFGSSTCDDDYFFYLTLTLSSSFYEIRTFNRGVVNSPIEDHQDILLEMPELNN